MREILFKAKRIDNGVQDQWQKESHIVRVKGAVNGENN